MKAYSKKAKITVVSASLFLLPFSCAYGETVVHTTRDDSYAVIRNLKKQSADSASQKPKPRLPRPYSFEQAKGYAEMHPDDITLHEVRGKDRFGDFSKNRFFDFLGRTGNYNAGSSFWGWADYTGIRLTLDYGSESYPIKPVAAISFYVSKTAIAGYSPKYFTIIFYSGYEKTISIQKKLETAYYVYRGFLVNSFTHDNYAYIILSNEDIYDIYRHGDIANVYVSDDYGRIAHFFYSGDKQTDKKRQLTYGFEHIARLLNINKKNPDLHTVLKNLVL